MTRLAIVLDLDDRLACFAHAGRLYASFEQDFQATDAGLARWPASGAAARVGAPKHVQPRIAATTSGATTWAAGRVYNGH